MIIKVYQSRTTRTSKMQFFFKNNLAQPLRNSQTMVEFWLQFTVLWLTPNIVFQSFPIVILWKNVPPVPKLGAKYGKIKIWQNPQNRHRLHSILAQVHGPQHSMLLELCWKQWIRQERGDGRKSDLGPSWTLSKISNTSPAFFSPCGFVWK